MVSVDINHILDFDLGLLDDSDANKLDDKTLDLSSESHCVEGCSEDLPWLNHFPEVETFDDIMLGNPFGAGSLPNHHTLVPALDKGTMCNGSNSRTGSRITSCSGAAFLAPVKARSKRLRRLRANLQSGPQPWWLNEKENRVKDEKIGVRVLAMGRKCLHCGVEKTPQWRAGPQGPKTLCNACGVRYKSGRLVPEYRPANSPTFSSRLHSNSHRKVLEMRKKKVMMGLSVAKPFEKGSVGELVM